MAKHRRSRTPSGRFGSTEVCKAREYSRFERRKSIDRASPARRRDDARFESRIGGIGKHCLGGLDVVLRARAAGRVPSAARRMRVSGLAIIMTLKLPCSGCIFPNGGSSREFSIRARGAVAKSACAQCVSTIARTLAVDPLQMQQGAVESSITDCGLPATRAGV